jgi:four helix bundle protein
MIDQKHFELKDRTEQFAIRVLHLADALPRARSANAIANQVVRSGTSVASNYWAAGRSRSRADFVSKIGIVVEEADETVFWLELLSKSGIVKPQRLTPLLKEANELVAIFAASRQTAKSRKTKNGRGDGGDHGDGGDSR